MKKFFILVIALVFRHQAYAQQDSILNKTEELQEVVVTADGQIEMSNKTLLLPTQLEKKHAANGFNLLYLMQTPELEVSPCNRSITTHNGGEVILCINGMEALPEDVASLSAKNIRTIEYIRTPSGKYAGKAGLVNFVTIKMNYGGNVYLSANEGFAYPSGDYLAFADFNKKRYTLSLTASGDWHRDHSYTEGNDRFVFSDNSTLERNYKDESQLKKSNSQAMRLRLSSIGYSHRLNTYISLTRQAMPSFNTIQGISYTEPYGITKRTISSNSQSIAPSAYANYTLWLPKQQALDITASASMGHNKYHSLYAETQQSPLTSDVTEDNLTLSGNARYSKTLKSNLTLMGMLNNDYKHYTDDYDGTAMGKQRLTSNVTVGLLQLSKSSEKYYLLCFSRCIEYCRILKLCTQQLLYACCILWRKLCPQQQALVVAEWSFHPYAIRTVREELDGRPNLFLRGYLWQSRHRTDEGIRKYTFIQWTDRKITHFPIIR